MKKTADSTPAANVSDEASASSSSFDTNLGVYCHLLGLLLYLGIPFGNIIGPLALWLAKKDADEFLRATGIHVLNFQISLSLYAVVCVILALAKIGLFLLPFVLIFGLSLSIYGAFQARKGEIYRYPATIRFLRQ